MLLILIEQHVLKLEVLAIDPTVTIIELYHINAFLRCYKRRAHLIRYLLMG